ncbi:2,3-bisphosphoglycerate-dependent phosphoglycerate mutase [Parachlamydia sp. AcF125]|uniref:2,3-bisphosphoglycerate-dependent phosphoglycerate mutase n=1 Tax=Parachlamydia sp. AcF125 TaxID=2795736 RepID=UPI001BCA1227|nr:2,3-bisphosphoglycerate-dependent phosphoglycerate mutase [Parachlamydia sp. AcF125]MBS4168252.1 2,3-bisphosphoglycerate-dependent phosphoglycerate mutase [Parachlamydia sp. AcF125]
MNKLILMRHGQSEWNRLNLFTGWVDIPLSGQGIKEALAGGDRIKDIPIDIIFTTSLMRAQMTAMLAMSRHSSGKTPVILHPQQSRLKEWGKIYGKSAEEACIPVICAWELNERMYGELQGLNKAETAEKFGAEQVRIWRRSFDIPPPNGESLKMTAARSIPYFEENILPCLLEGKNVFVSAHGNSLRSILMYLDKLSPEEVLNLELATGEPIFYTFQNGKIARE